MVKVFKCNVVIIVKYRGSLLVGEYLNNDCLFMKCIIMYVIIKNDGVLYLLIWKDVFICCWEGKID